MTATSTFTVPTVDIAPYVSGGSAEEKAAVARALDEAARTVGFIQIQGHGIPAALSDGLAGAIDEFFGLPLETKKQYRQPKGVNRGYTPPKTERLSLSLGVEKPERMNDFFEAFNVGVATSDFPGLSLPESVYPENVWPAEAPGFEPRVEAWFAAASAVGRVLLRIFEDALGLAPGYFAPFTDHSIDVLRINNYALPDGLDVTLEGDLVGMGEHTDFGIVTLLWADRVAGLQVLGSDGSWNDVMPEPGALLINLGDLTGRWTNENWKSTLHRVKPPVIDGTIRRRRSAAFFLDGNVDATVSTLPTCLTPGEPELYAPITVGDHITAKLNGSRGLVRNTDGTEREAARVEASAYRG
ncbi:2-oxoglutarate and iron-dependent oxygenase domain-containing protein [Herbiconiux sp. 11R-BC]|uniref:isopenicillin N synthase family dioxygenase n=1 Tax=Herbiconiux sp. 11R-BC TaxID=3111637 RepID=UPI003BFCAA09